MQGFNQGPYPGEDALIAELSNACLSQFGADVGADYEGSVLEIAPVLASQERWENGYRDGYCALFEVDYAKLTGTAYQSGW